MNGEEDNYWPNNGVEYYDCPTCKGKGTINPLTAPPKFFCVGTETCPDCDGTGECP